MTDFASTYAQIVREDQEQTRQWIADLQQRGIKAAHPDDGWNNREQHTLRLVYPYYTYPISVGDLVALGTHKHYHLVQITNIEPMRLVPDLLTYSYEPVDPEI